MVSNWRDLIHAHAIAIDKKTMTSDIEKHAVLIGSLHHVIPVTFQQMNSWYGRFGLSEGVEASF